MTGRALRTAILILMAPSPPHPCSKGVSGKQGPYQGLGLWARTFSQLPACSPAPKGSNPYPQHLPSCAEGKLAPTPSTGLLTSEEGQFVWPPPPPGPVEEVWLPVSNKPELEGVSVSR